MPQANNQNTYLGYAVVALLSSGGSHIATKSVSDLPTTSATITDCTPFSDHAREHEQIKCDIQLNDMKVKCSPKK